MAGNIESESQESGRSSITPGSPMNTILKDGNKWKEDDLNKLGIQYCGPVLPISIFSKIQNAHAPPLLRHRGSNFLSTYDAHVRGLQQIFDDIFDLHLDSFELLEVSRLTNEWHHRCGSNQHVFSDSEPVLKKEDLDLDEEQVNAFRRPESSACSEVFLQEEDMDLKKRAKELGRKLLNEINRAQKNTQKQKTAYMDTSRPATW